MGFAKFSSEEGGSSSRKQVFGCPRKGTSGRPRLQNTKISPREFSGVELGGLEVPGAQFGDLNTTATRETSESTSTKRAMSRSNGNRSYVVNELCQIARRPQRHHQRRQELARDGRPQPCLAISPSGVWLNDGPPGKIL